MMKYKDLLPTHLDPVNTERSAKDQRVRMSKVYIKLYKSLEPSICLIVWINDSACHILHGYGKIETMCIWARGLYSHPRLKIQKKKKNLCQIYDRLNHNFFLLFSFLFSILLLICLIPFYSFTSINSSLAQVSVEHKNHNLRKSAMSHKALIF